MGKVLICRLQEKKGREGRQERRKEREEKETPRDVQLQQFT